MPYEKGHKYHAPKARRVNVRHLSGEVRDRLSASIFIDFHLAVASNRDPYIEVDEDGEPYVAVKERGAIEPTLEERLASMKWLADRGWGQAPQMLHVEQIMRVDTSQQGPDLSALLKKPAAVRALRDAIRMALRAAPAPAPSNEDAQDAEFRELPAGENVKERADLEPGERELDGEAPHETAPGAVEDDDQH